MLFPYFVYIAQFTKFTGGSSLLKERLLLIEKSKAEESPLLKKQKTKNRPIKERKSTILSRKEKKVLCESY